MQPKLWQEVNRVLDLVDELPKAEQDQSLRRACAGNEQLETEVRRQLRRMVDCPQGFLDLEPLESDREVALTRDSGSGAVPEVDADFRVISELGRGGGGVVYEAQQRSLDRRVALKVLRPGSDDDGRRLRREAKVLGGLNEPGIAQIYDVGQHGAWPWIAMELVDGHDLAQEISLQLGMGSAGDAPAILPSVDEEHYLAKRLTLVRDVAHALHAAHELGVIHRDVKSANIVLGRNGVPKLVDLGLARTASSETVTAHDFLAGSVHTMSAEQLRCVPLDRRTDVYSLGVVLYQLLAGQLPFPGRESPAVIAKIQSGVTPLLREAKPKLSADLEAVCAKAMAFDRGQRYSNALAFAEDLERLLEGRPVKAQRWTNAYRAQLFVRRNRASLALACGALVTVAALFTWSSSRSHLSGMRATIQQDVITLEQQAETGIARGDTVLLGSAMSFVRRVESDQNALSSSQLKARSAKEEVQKYAREDLERLKGVMQAILDNKDELLVDDRKVHEIHSRMAELYAILGTQPDTIADDLPRLSISAAGPGMSIELFGAHLLEGGYEDTPTYSQEAPIEEFPVIPGRYRIVIRDGSGSTAELSRWLGEWGRHYDEGQVEVLPTGTVLPGMVRVPAGNQRIVLPDKDTRFRWVSFPVKAFYLDAYEVSNADYALFLASFNDKGERDRHTGTWYREGSALGHVDWADRPIVDLAWWQARAYCEWAGKRLPTELEWAQAMSGQGPEPRPFPWGSDAELVPALTPTTSTNFDGLLDPNSYMSRFLAGTHPTRHETVDRTPGSTPIYHLAGNAREWVDCVAVNSFDQRIYPLITHRRIKGGSWDHTENKPSAVSLLSHGVEPANPTFRNGFIGFRCAKSDPRAQ
ncbi:MAG: serine/threonine protein kinase/formylglycine-generating enzyme required for sulfatase activity [Planctomycetota bacterium]|jgi:serine/threonine protein kinase/formylglycine-generating enzyme required for sulfatase activity